MARTDYVGKAGELAAMSEFLLLEYNVAIPQVDTGDDVWVILDKRGTVWGVQVLGLLYPRSRRSAFRSARLA